MLRPALSLIERHYIAVILLAAALGLVAPEVFLPVKPYIPMLLGWVMFGIGLTIRTEHLRALLTRPAVALFALGKFALMPLLAYGAGLAFGLSDAALIGMVILGACPGGVAANVMSYMAKADTALTVLLTIFTTLLSPLLTPLIIYLFLHQDIQVQVAPMVEKLFWVVLFPLADALLLRRFFARPVEKIEWVFPPFSMLAIALIVAFVAAANRATLLENPWQVLGAVLLFNVAGYALGYSLARLCRQPRAACQSVAFEYGMQDSALGIILATGFFTPLAALPSALCSLVQNLSGPVLAKWFANRTG